MLDAGVAVSSTRATMLASADRICKGNSMKKAITGLLLLGPLFAAQSFGQSGAVIPQGGAGHAGQASCVILKRMGPADEITSHLYSFGIRGKQFQYIEGKLPDGFPFHGRLTDHDVRNLQGRGAEVIVLNQNYTSEELKQARDDCRGQTGTTPNQAEAKPIPSPASTTIAASPAAAAASSAPVAGLVSVVVKSTPDGADISVDGKFVGSTPSTLKLSPGDHTISVGSSGFKNWQRTMSLSAGSDVTLNATLEKAQ
jgi:PEGA domain